MRANRLFWGLAVIIAGVLLLLSNLGLLPVNAWNLIWPLGLVLLGLWFLVAPRLARGDRETRDLALPLEGARSADVRISFGAGRLIVGASGVPGQLLGGRFTGGVRESVQRSGEHATLRLEGVFAGPPMVFADNHGFDWQVQLSPDVDMRLTLETGASENVLDLTRLRLSELNLKTGASSTQASLPANPGQMRVKVESGAASVVLRVPPGVAASISGETFLSGFEIDTTRFPMLDKNRYQSPDYATAANRIEIKTEMGVGSIKVL